VEHGKAALAGVRADVYSELLQFLDQLLAVRGRGHDQDGVADLQAGGNNAAQAVDERGMFVVKMDGMDGGRIRRHGTPVTDEDDAIALLSLTQDALGAGAGLHPLRWRT